MTARPHDVSDLYFAPVVLELDRRLDEFASMPDDEIELSVTMATDRQPRNPTDRADLVLLALTHLLDTHGWALSWVPRGLQVRHDNHVLVLGTPRNLRTYVGL